MKRTQKPNSLEDVHSRLQAFNGALLILFCFVIAGVGAPEPFDCGSTGAYGPMNITNDLTLALPNDGVFHCTTITVAAGKTLRFTNNTLNTPVYLLANGDVIINGIINLSAVGRLGGPGGFDGGFGGLVYEGYQSGGSGFGPGGGMLAGQRNCAAFGSPGENGLNTSVYGNSILYPVIGGSGGCGEREGAYGGGGGGAILIASNTRITVSGSVISSGAPGAGGGAGGGSGGAIRLVAPVVSGSGSLSVPGAQANGGGWGRIRIDCTDFMNWRSLNVSQVASIGRRMVVFPSVIPRLDIVEAVGTSIPEGTSSEAVIELPLGSPTNHVVRVQARNFTNDIPIRVVVTPENAPSTSYDALISQGSGNPPSTNVNVVLPAGQIYHINAWTR